jgi:hypothetical protein
MSYKVTNVFTRPNTDVVFHVSNVSDEYINHVMENYKNVGKVFDITTDVSPNGLMLTISWVWASQAEHDAFNIDPIAVSQRNSRDAYNQANGITMTTTVTEQ